ncbi:MAG: 50S ribosomal protein L22 [Candidatus Shapirobacteria bacterium]|nr:50S ribosomal protein L22 [Candidatus Shapirobacteria bacterium]
MEVIAKSKFVRISHKKLNLISWAIRGLSVAEAEKVLASLNKKGSRLLSLVLKQGIANAVKNFGLVKETLKIKSLQIGKGPSYKRGRAVSRGQWHPILKRTSHITLILNGEKAKVVKEPKEIKEVKKTEKVIKKERKNGTKS